jgi:galactoside O-acetyltransferase
LCGYTIGREVYIGDDLIVIEELYDSDRIIIEDRVSIAPRLTLITSSHPNNSVLRNSQYCRRGDIHIKHDAWIGCGVIIMPGVTIGESSIIGAGAIVDTDIPPHSIAVGMPAKVVSKVIMDQSAILE